MTTESSTAPPISTCDQIRAQVRAMRSAGMTIGLVPTMGALHQGHLSLVRQSMRQCDRTIVSIFVNPTQFGPGEDLAKYPRSLDADLKLLGELDQDAPDQDVSNQGSTGGRQAPIVFCPSEPEMYPDGYSTSVNPPVIARRWEGACRPHHFGGVATVVLKLFAAVPADVAYFGQKDYQQLRVIQTMVRDLNLGIRVRGCPIVRQDDGLALSSRNRYLSPADRSRALSLRAALGRAKDAVQSGATDAAGVRQKMLETLSVTDAVDYAAIADADSLDPLETVTANAIALVAAHVGKTRLIDNCFLSSNQSIDSLDFHD